MSTFLEYSYLRYLLWHDKLIRPVFYGNTLLTTSRTGVAFGLP